MSLFEQKTLLNGTEFDDSVTSRRGRPIAAFDLVLNEQVSCGSLISMKLLTR